MFRLMCGGLGIITPTTPFTLGSESLANIEEEGIFEQIPLTNCKSGREGGKGRMIFFPPAEDQQFQMSRWPELVFKGPVHRTEKSPKTELDQTD